MCIRDTKLCFFLFLQNLVLVIGLLSLGPDQSRSRKVEKVYILRSDVIVYINFKIKLTYSLLKEDCLTINKGSSTIF